MSSASLVLQQQQQQQQSCGAARRSRPPATSSGPDTHSSRSSVWRPWLGGPEPDLRRRLSSPYSRPAVPGFLSSYGKLPAFQHPVRLFWPKSKSFDYLYSDGEALLRNLPIQATISFYEDSDSEEEDEETWEKDGDTEEGLKNSLNSSPVTH